MHYLYKLSTGVFDGRGIDIDPFDAARLASMIPEGYGAKEGPLDIRRQRVSLTTGELVQYMPDKPPDTPLATFSWDPASWSWVPSPTASSVAVDVKIRRDELLAACDWVVARAFEQAVPVPAAWAQYRQALRDITKQPGFPMSVVWPEAPQG